MRAADANIQTGLSDGVSGPAFSLVGGIYQIIALATSWNGGSATLTQLGPDSATYLTVTDGITANDGDTIYLPPGTFRWVIVGATGVSVSVTRVPGE